MKNKEVEQICTAHSSVDCGYHYGYLPNTCSASEKIKQSPASFKCPFLVVAEPRQEKTEDAPVNPDASETT
jgi:hypothetical protein